MDKYKNCIEIIMGKLLKNDSKFDFEYKSVPKIQTNAKVNLKD